ncbi:MAG: EcsC family protein, partial [Clostridia bacterium]|nr:EcsC family protein [Clostridia bacterium]
IQRGVFTARDTEALIRQAAGGLSKELLYMKFLQGIPIVGAVGGAYDAVYMKRVMEYTELKYRRRFFSKNKMSS